MASAGRERTDIFVVVALPYIGGEIAMPRLFSLCSVLAVVLLVAIPARADVSWEFIITAAIDLGGPCCGPEPLPALGGGLIVSDAAFLRGSVSYSWMIDSNLDLSAAGDTDFSLGLVLLRQTLVSCGMAVRDTLKKRCLGGNGA
jgi:hypothetical protein